MSAETQRLMDELREDHRNIALVLDVLEDAVRSAEADNDPDFELLDEIMRYMTVYPDAVHHPKEDLVYDALREKRPDLAEGLDDVPQDHREIAAMGIKLRHDIDGIVAGAAVRREQFVQDARVYIDRLRGHMQWEEDDLFKRVDEMIAGESPRGKVDDYIYIKDRVYELEIESAFRRLTESLKKV